jgi:hypothetical protein
LDALAAPNERNMKKDKTMSHMTRRKFLASLGLGAGAALLMPISDRLISTALGMETPIPKRLFLVNVYMITPSVFWPTDHPAYQDPIVTEDWVAPYVPSGWAGSLAPLAAYHDRMVVIDGLKNKIRTHQHRAGTAALSCANPADSGNCERWGFPAGNLTIDRHIANGIGANSAHRTVLWGLTQDGIDSGRKTGLGMFSTGRSQNVAHFEHANEMLDQLFPDPDMNTGGSSNVNSFRPLRDRLVGDLGRLKSRLASEEIMALESYEQAIIDFDRRQEALSMLSCTAPPSAPEEKDADLHLASMMSQSLLALQCGLTNVVAAQIGSSNNHNKHMPDYQEVNVATYGHGTDDARMAAVAKLHEIHMREVARVLDSLSQATEQDGSSMMDHTAFVYCSGNGHAGDNSVHHAGKGGEDNWPMLIVAGEQTGLNTGGRFIGASRHQWKGERRMLPDAFASLSEGLGVPIDGFGEPSEPTPTPIAELMK